MEKIKNKNQYCTFYIVRHGETVGNVQKILQGQKDYPLTLQGIKQTRGLAKALKKIKFNAVFASDLIRAHKTAQILALDKKIIVKTTKLLRERCFGKYQGHSYKKINKELKEQYLLRNKLVKEARFKFRLHPTIETDEEIISRFITFLRQTSLIYPRKNVLVVSHGGIMRAFLIHLGFALYRELPPGSIGNTGYVVVESDGIDFFIKKFSGITK